MGRPSQRTMADSVTRPRPLPLVYQFAAGAIAGVTELLCLYPLDVVKTRIQLQGSKGTASGVYYDGMVDCFRKIVAEEGFSRLYRGLVPPLMLEAPKRAVKFAANDWWGQTYKRVFNAEKATQGLSVLTGCSAGATESIVVVPFELVKIRLQDKNSAGKYTGPMDCVRQIIRNEGLLGMYNGLEPTFWRLVWHCPQYAFRRYQVPGSELTQGSWCRPEVQLGNPIFIHCCEGRRIWRALQRFPTQGPAISPRRGRTPPRRRVHPFSVQKAAGPSLCVRMSGSW